MPRFFILLALVLAALPLDAAAQGFSLFNGRNHPELDWQVAETEHFRLMYPARLAGIELEAAPIAEASYAALTANLEVSFDEKIRIYFSDEDEIVNGFAVPLGAGYTNIWVHQNDVAEVWTGREKWLRKVIAHELAHIVHYRAVKTGSSLVNNVLGDPLPRFWTEGLAQYQTERWDAQRGDRWLRTAVLADQLAYDDGRSAWNGRLLYAVGNAQVRYFADQYGDSTLARLLAHRTRRLGLFRVHDFGEAFEAVTDTSYRDFYDAWRRHVNVYYNVIAGQLEPLDSLGTDPLGLPGQYLYDVQASPDARRLAVLLLPSLARPVRRLVVVDRDTKEARVVAEGAIKAPVAWSPDGERLAFARLTRGEAGSLLNDLFVVGADGADLRRLTHSRRAASPTFAPDGRRLAFVGSAAGTGNVFLLDLEAGEETPVTDLEGDIQLGGLTWHPSDDQLALSRFLPDGTRDLALLDLGSGLVTPLTDGRHDDRQPVWSPDGERLAFTSLRDRVPNAFVLDTVAPENPPPTPRRLTYLARGVAATSWLPPDSTHPAGALVGVVAASKARDLAYPIPADRTAPSPEPDVPAGYATWTDHEPPQTLPTLIPPDASPITSRYAYRSWGNLTHALSGAAPFWFAPDDWGVAAGTVWIEPLAKHLIAVGGGLSVPSLREKSAFSAYYVNNQLYPTLSFTAYRLPGSATFYGDEVLLEDYLGGDVQLVWPFNPARPFVQRSLGVRLRYADVQLINPEDFRDLTGLPAPQSGRLAQTRLTLEQTKQRPYRYNTIHPLDGRGVRLRVTAGAPILSGTTEYVRADLRAFTVEPALGAHRLYLYGRAEAQAGTALPQAYIGFSRRDGLQVELPSFIPLAFSDADRVRGYRAFALGNRLLFGTAEYRMLLAPSLETEVLGLVRLGALSVAAFVDAGMVWTDADLDGATRRTGVGAELKNEVILLGLFRFGHAVGLAQPASDLGTADDYDLYYRIRAAVAF